MNKSSVQTAIIAIVLILVQVVVLNHICLFGVAVPFAFIYVVLRLPVSLSKEWLFTIAFLLGLTIDIFSDTAGVNSLSCLLLAALKRPVLHLYFPREDELSDPTPSISTLGMAVYFKFALSMSAIYCMAAFTLESLSLFRIWHVVMCIVASTLLTTAIIIGIDSITLPRREKRL